MREVCYLLGASGHVLWSDAGSSPTALADSRARWQAMWLLRDRLAEIAHSHPLGPLAFSDEDETTMAAVTAALGRAPRFSVIAPGGMLTRIGRGCLFMVSSHIARDCRVGNHVVLANGAALGGHVEMGDFAIVGGLAGVHQYVRIGESALCAAGAMVSMDVPPFCTVAGDRARLHGLNLVGLRRRGFSSATISGIKRAYRLLFQGSGPRRLAIVVAQERLGHLPEVKRLVDFLAASRRGVCR